MSGDAGDTTRRPSAERVRPSAERVRSARTGPAERSVPPERPVLPNRSRDEQDIGWGDEPAQRDDDWYRSERPPHHE
jgi:hypothetical protein